MSKRRNYTIEYKVGAIDWYNANGKSIHKAAKHFVVDRKRIREWIQNEAILRSHAKRNKLDIKRLHPGRAPVSDELERAVLEFLLDERIAGKTVSNDDLRKKALQFSKTIPGLEEFQASDGWLSHWKRRNSVVMQHGTNECNKLPQDFHEKTVAFKKEVECNRQKHNYTFGQIGNMGQAICKFDMAPGSLIIPTATASDLKVSTSSSAAKKGFSVALAAFADGKKLPAYLIFKEPKGVMPPRVLPQLLIPSNIRITGSKTGWMSDEDMQDWIHHVWGPNVDDSRRLLVLEHAPIHTMPHINVAIGERGTDLVFVPTGCGPICQPAEMWITHFKQLLKNSWLDWRCQNMRTPGGNLKIASRQEIIDWVSRAWDAVTEEIIRHSFKACGISLALDGTEDSLLNDRLAVALVEQNGDDNMPTDKEEPMLHTSDLDDRLALVEENGDNNPTDKEETPKLQTAGSDDDIVDPSVFFKVEAVDSDEN